MNHKIKNNLLLRSYGAQVKATEAHRKRLHEQVHMLHIYNNLIAQKMYDAFDLLDEEKIDGVYLWQFRKLAEKIWNEYAAKMKQRYTKEAFGLLYDYANNFYRKVEHDFDIFYLSLLADMSNHGVQRKEILAHLACAVCAADIAIEAWEMFFAKYRRLIGEDLSRPYRFMRLDKLKLNLSRVEEELSKREKCQSIDLTANKQSVMAYDALINRLSNEDTLNNAAHVALEINGINTDRELIVKN